MRRWVWIAALASVGCPADEPAADAGSTSAGSDTTTTSAAMTSDSTGAAPTTTEPEPEPTTDTGGAPIGGCGVDPGFTGAVASELDVSDLVRRYVVVLPDDYDPDRAYPLVYMLHGRGSNGEQLRLYAGVEEAAAGEAVFVYPDGLPLASMNNQTGWDLTASGRDVAFLDELHAVLVDNLCIDESRVYATGHSFGGFFSNTLGCLRGDRFRAIAPVAGGGPAGGCVGPVAAWIAHGDGDMVVPTVMGETSAATWRGVNGCSERAAPTEPDPCVAYAGCGDGDEVVWCLHTESGMGIGAHTWPTFAGAAIWEFFASH